MRKENRRWSLGGGLFFPPSVPGVVLATWVLPFESRRRRRPLPSYRSCATHHKPRSPRGRPQRSGHGSGQSSCVTARHGDGAIDDRRFCLAAFTGGRGKAGRRLGVALGRNGQVQRRPPLHDAHRALPRSQHLPAHGQRRRPEPRRTRTA
jgi:hypothetical protein